MKLALLLLGTLVYISVFFTYYKKVKIFHKSYEKKVHQYFSKDNPLAVSVTFEPEQRNITNKGEESPLPNKKFTYKPKDFEIDDTDLLRSLGLACMPTSFGYSVKRGKEVFPDKHYPKCSKVTGQNDTYMHIDRTSNTLYMNCPEETNNKYVYGPMTDKKIIKREEGHLGWKVVDYDGPVNAKKIEFGLGSCKKDGEDFMQGYMTPIFNRSAYEKAKAKVVGTPKIVYFLTLDSLSRRHFFRKTPKIVEYLNSLNKGNKFSVFDFKLHNNQADTSPKNQVPIFSGSSQYGMLSDSNKNKDLLGKKALWNILRDKGYINLVAFEDCDGSFVNYFGRYPNIEYSVGPFYCAVEKFTSNSFRKEGTEQRCLGGHMSHYYILNYTNDIINLNLGANMMLYVHLSAGHEYTGNHAATLNEDIVEHLENLLNKHGDDNDILIFLQADHGMRYGDFFRDLDAYQENKLPGLFVIASRSLLDKHEFSYHALHMNTQRLVSKLDYRKTVLEMEGLQDIHHGSVNLMKTIASKNRVCDDLGIRAWDCSCLKMNEVRKYSEKIDDVLQQLKNYAEDLINSETYSYFKYPQGKICKKVELGDIKKVYHTAVNNVEEMYKLEIDTPTKSGVKFSITYVISSSGKYMAPSRSKFRFESTAFGRYPIKVRVLSIARLDSYAGPCEIIATQKGIRPELCICA